MLLHIVFLKFKPGTTDAEIEDLNQSLAAVWKSIPGILEYHWGVNVSVEKLEQGYHHGFVMKFTDAAARDNYLPHPLHLPIAEKGGRLGETILVYDLEY